MSKNSLSIGLSELKLIGVSFYFFGNAFSFNVDGCLFRFENGSEIFK